MAHVFKIQKYVDESKTKVLIKVETLQKPSDYIWVFYKMVLKLLKSPNRILQCSKYWLKALKWENWLTIENLFLWESKAKFKSLSKQFLYIWVSYKTVLKPVKSLNRIF